VCLKEGKEENGENKRESEGKHQRKKTKMCTAQKLAVRTSSYL